jgi:hypothetical protein
MDVLRYKYRPPAIQPELTDGRGTNTCSHINTVTNISPTVSLSIRKCNTIIGQEGKGRCQTILCSILSFGTYRTILYCASQPVEVDPYGGDIVPQRKEAPIFLATHTQIKRQELYVRSNEEEYRRKHFPTIFERIELQKEWAKEQQREARIAAEREAVQLRIDQMTRQKNGERLEEDELSLLEDIDDQINKIGATDDFEQETNKKQTTNAEYTTQILEFKEQKVVSTRDTDQYHREYTMWERRKKAVKISLGYVGKQRQDCTEILPWLLIGRRELATNMQLLLQLNITHILNMTHDVPNAFVKHFVYEKVPVRDSEDSDIGLHFDRIISFIDRVEACKGRVSYRM